MEELPARAQAGSASCSPAAMAVRAGKAVLEVRAGKRYSGILEEVEEK